MILRSFLVGVFFTLLSQPVIAAMQPTGTDGTAITLDPSGRIGTCKECAMATDTDVLKGTLDAISLKASMLQVATVGWTRVITFDDETILAGVDDFSAIKPDSSLEIEYLKQGGVLRAVSIKVAADETLLESNQIDAKMLSNLLSDNATPFTLVDARPEPSYAMGHIRGAVSIYNGVFDQNTGKLPTSKDQLIVYYCDGTA